MEWWNSMSTMQQWFAGIAIPATAIMLLQFILLLFGIGDHDVDVDAGGADADFDADAAPGHESDGLGLFTIRGVITFFTIGGWLGVVLGYTQLSVALVILISFLAGAVGLVLTGWALKSMTKLASDGRVLIENAVGQIATAYIPIGAEMSSTGKVNLTLQERFVEFDAMTKEQQEIKTGEKVEVVACLDQSTLLVRRMKAEDSEKQQ